jgi:MFS family permease
VLDVVAMTGNVPTDQIRVNEVTASSARHSNSAAIDNEGIHPQIVTAMESTLARPETVVSAPPLTSSSREAERTLLMSCVGTFVVLVAYTVPLTTLSQTATTLGTSPSNQAWILSSMSVGLSAALIASGAIADDYGRRRIFVAGAMVLALSSLLAALATSTLVFVVARVFQGLGGAALTSCSLGLLAHAFPVPAARARATGFWSASLGAGIAAGPLIASGLAVLGGWRASQGAVAGLAALVAAFAARLLVESRSSQPRAVDYLGTALLASGLSSVLAGFVLGRAGWTRPLTVVLLAGGLVLLVAFVRSQAQRPAAMLDLSLFRRADFVGVTVAALANGLGVIALMAFVPTLIMRGLGRDATTASLALLCWSAVSVASALYARRLPASVSARHQLALSLLGVAVGQAALTGLAPGVSVLRLLPGMTIAGVASGFLNAALARQAVSSVPVGSGSFGSGANNTARYVGAALGITIVVVLAGRRDPNELVAGWNVAAWVTATLSVVGAVAVSLCKWESLESAAR